MNELLSCPKCRESLEVPVELLGGKVRCGRCSAVFTARETGYTQEPDERTPARSRREREARAAGRKAIFVILAVFTVITLLCCGGIAYFFYSSMHPKWVSYESAGGEFTAKFPGEPRTGSRLTGRGIETATAVTAERSMFQEKYFVYFLPLPNEDRGKAPKVVLDELAAGLLKQNPGAKDFKPRVSRTAHGHEALDLWLELDDNNYLSARLVIANDKVYVVGAEGSMEPDNCAWFTEFLDAFQPKKADPNKPPPPAPKKKNPIRPKP